MKMFSRLLLDFCGISRVDETRNLSLLKQL